MIKMKEKDSKAYVAAGKEASKHSGQSLTLTEPLPCQTFDEYQCTGNVQIDFPRLCAVLDIKNIPAVSSKPYTGPEVETGGAEQPALKRSWKKIVTHSLKETEPSTASAWTMPCLQVELENNSPLSTKGLKIYGWKVDDQIFQVLRKILPHLSSLQNLFFWQAGLTDQMVMSLTNVMSLGSSLRVVYLEGNPLPNQSYHLLLSQDSVITHLFLRNNRIGDEGAHLIGSALSTPRTTNKNLRFLSLAFNSIGDAGAAYIAQGLRLNRALLYLSLANNQIRDSGAAHFSKVLCEFPLTHEEVVERRKLLASKMEMLLIHAGVFHTFELEPARHPPERLGSFSGVNSPIPVKVDPKGNPKKKKVAKKEEKKDKVTAIKDNTKKGVQKRPKTPDTKEPQAESGKAEGKKTEMADVQEDKSSTAVNEPTQPEEEIVNPLLDQSVQSRDGQVFLPGNTTLVFLSLAGNKITDKSLPLFLSSLEKQTEGGGLLRLCLQRNHFSPDCEAYVKIHHLMLPRDPLIKCDTEQTEEEEENKA